MKSTTLKDFKQIYNDKITQEQKEYDYQVIIIKDTDDYTYRILNVTSGTIWKNYRFATYKQANDFLMSHPHYTGRDSDIQLGAHISHYN